MHIHAYCLFPSLNDKPYMGRNRTFFVHCQSPRGSINIHRIHASSDLPLRAVVTVQCCPHRLHTELNGLTRTGQYWSKTDRLFWVLCICHSLFLLWLSEGLLWVSVCWPHPIPFGALPRESACFITISKHVAVQLGRVFQWATHTSDALLLWRIWGNIFRLLGHSVCSFLESWLNYTVQS